MAHPDLNLLIALDVLLDEGSVAGAARRLGLSPSAMSRTLARLREATGDPLLVRAGRVLVPSPRARELRARVGPLVHDATALLRPAERVDLARLDRTFTFRTSEGFVETFGPALIARVAREAPGVRLCFTMKADKESTHLREGTVDLETGVLGRRASPEVRAHALFRDGYVGIVRRGHPLATGRLTPARFAAAGHVHVVRPDQDRAPIDVALAALGLTRAVAVTVDGFAKALALARATDLVATVPDRHTRGLREGLVAVPLPVPLDAFTVSLLWHPRMDGDAAHVWLRGCVREVCGG
jgi:DNA-binding transcriptional LysR family regulator